MGLEPTYFSWKENVITIRLFAKEFAVRAFVLNLALWRRNTHFHYRLKCRTAGASDGDRTRTTCLEGRDSTIELHPHSCSFHKYYLGRKHENTQVWFRPPTRPVFSFTSISLTTRGMIVDWFTGLLAYSCALFCHRYPVDV